MNQQNNTNTGLKIALVFVFLVTAVLRLHNLTTLGLEHDEVANWLIDRTILDENNYAVYYPAAYGRFSHVNDNTVRFNAGLGIVPEGRVGSLHARGAVVFSHSKLDSLCP